MISTKHMTWIRESRTLATEESDHGNALRWVRAYPDACDLGLDVLSHRTGRVVRFVVTHEERREGDLLYRDLRPIDRSLDVTLRLFND